MLTSGKISYEVGGNVEATGFGGLFAMHRLVTRLGLVTAIDADLELLKIHLPYHESDHVLTLAYSVLCGGTRLEDVDRLRGDVPLMNGLGAGLLPDPTTTGDFLRRFAETDLLTLMDAVNSVRPALWRARGADLLGEVAYLDVDGTIVATTGQLNGSCRPGARTTVDTAIAIVPAEPAASNAHDAHQRGARPPACLTVPCLHWPSSAADRTDPPEGVPRRPIQQYRSRRGDQFDAITAEPAQRPATPSPRGNPADRCRAPSGPGPTPPAINVAALIATWGHIPPGGRAVGSCPGRRSLPDNSCRGQTRGGGGCPGWDVQGRRAAWRVGGGQPGWTSLLRPPFWICGVPDL